MKTLKSYRYPLEPLLKKNTWAKEETEVLLAEQVKMVEKHQRECELIESSAIKTVESWRYELQSSQLIDPEHWLNASRYLIDQKNSLVKKQQELKQSELEANRVREQLQEFYKKERLLSKRKEKLLSDLYQQEQRKDYKDHDDLWIQRNQGITKW